MRRKEVQHALEILDGELKAELQNALESLKEAKSIATKHKNLLAKATDWLARLEDPEAGVSAKLNLADSQIQLLNQTIGKSESVYAAIQSHLATVEQEVATMQVAYNNFQTIAERVNDPNSGMEAVLTEASKLNLEVKNIAAQATDGQRQIGTLLSSVQQNTQAIKLAYVEFQQIKTRIDDPDDGLDAVLVSSRKSRDDLAAINKESETLYKEISRYKDSAARNIKSIEAIKESSERAFAKVQDYGSESENLKNRIAAIFEIVSQTGHANYFDTRRKRVELVGYIWLGLAVLTIAATVTLGIIYIMPLVNDKTDHATDIAIEAILIRVSILTPLLALSVYGLTNYGRERRLAEQYAFKAVSASTVEGSLALLDRSLASIPPQFKDEKIAEFGIDTIQALHDEPLELMKSTNVKMHMKNDLVS